MKNILLLFLLLLSPIITLAQTIDTAKVDTISTKFLIPQLNRDRTIRIYLPSGYNTTKTTYPVIYMQDAQQIFSLDKKPANNWQIDQFLKHLPAKQQCIIIGIDNDEKYRIAEYNPFDSYYAKQSGIFYTQFITETLKPYIDAHYRTKAGARHTAIAGSSMGGHISMYAALKYPQVFGSAGIFSPAFWLSPKIYGYAGSVAVINKRSGFYFVSGDKEGPETGFVARMDSIIRSKGLPPAQTPVTIIPGGKHNEQQWRIAFPAFYEWWMKRW